MAIRSIALAGMVADTSLYNIDGACVVGGAAAIPVGTVVGVTSADPVDGHKIVTLPSADAAPYGVVVRSHYETPDGTARVNEAVNVMSAGRIWVRASASPTAANKIGAAITVDATGKAGFAAAGATPDVAPFATGWTFAGGAVTNYAGAGTSTPIKQGESVDGILIEVQVKQK